MKTGRAKVTKRDWYAFGGFANPRCFRKANAKGVWSYYLTF